jgi:hypothetical protein
MTTTAELKARLEALRAQRDSAVARLSYDSPSVEDRTRPRAPERSTNSSGSCTRSKEGARAADPDLHLEGLLIFEPGLAHRRDGAAPGDG